MSIYSIYATKRSGHHAFIEWLCSGLSGNWVYFNNCKIYDGEIRYAVIESDFNLPGLEKNKPGLLSEALHTIGPDVEHLILSYENVDYENCCRCFFQEKQFRKHFGDQFRIVFLRDFFNSYASLFSWFERYKKEEAPVKALDEFKKCWGGLVSLYLKSGDDGFNSDGAKLVLPSFNEFSFEDNYRAGLAKKLNILNSDVNKELSLFGGGGNTFFDDKKNYTPSQEKLESRWKLVLDKEKFFDSIDEATLFNARSFAYFLNRPELFDIPERELSKKSGVDSESST
ncbi:hypothetical protein ACN06F_11910 [Vreelandella sp. 21]|uniref:hypothetical protein n=1 Tax=Vreelandella sp. 21 TaxID=3402864 RepID=UPI003D9A439C